MSINLIYFKKSCELLVSDKYKEHKDQAHRFIAHAMRVEY